MQIFRNRTKSLKWLITVYLGAKEQMKRKLKMLTNKESNKKNLIRVKKAKLIPLAAYPLNICRFTRLSRENLERKGTWKDKQLMKDFTSRQKNSASLRHIYKGKSDEQPSSKQVPQLCESEDH